LTGDEFDAAEAYRMGIAQEVVPADQVLPRALALAEAIAAQAPLGVQATLHSARLSQEKGMEASIAELVPEIKRLMVTQDAAEGVMSFMQRRPAVFTGR
jgi:enoyl-CoA hydratase